MNEGCGSGAEYVWVSAQEWADLAAGLDELRAGVVGYIRRSEVRCGVGPTGTLPENWFDVLRELAAEATDPAPSDAELRAIQERGRERMRLDQAETPYPPAVTLFAESVLTLLDHWCEGTATITEVAAAAWFFKRAVPWRAVEGYSDRDPALRDAFRDILARMAAAMLSITEGQTAG